MYSHEATRRNPQARPTLACMVSFFCMYPYLVPSLGSLAPRHESYPTICMPELFVSAHLTNNSGIRKTLSRLREFSVRR
jgi:hypothetical protein